MTSEAVRGHLNFRILTLWRKLILILNENSLSDLKNVDLNDLRGCLHKKYNFKLLISQDLLKKLILVRF